VLQNTPALIQQALDVGAGAIMVPKINTSADARRAVLAAAYRAGGRGACPGCAAGEWSMASWSEYVDQMNDAVRVIPLIETQEGAANAQEIGGVDGIEFAFFGPVDFAQDACLDPAESAALGEAWEGVRDGLHREGVQVGAPVGFGLCGADFATYGMDLITLREAAEGQVEAWRAADARTRDGGRPSREPLHTPVVPATEVS
jgi:4-hydroxy-2-oxoheptanedioate aldolase